jgi:hypothetical protein
MEAVDPVVGPPRAVCTDAIAAKIRRIHVQIAIPRDRDAEARRCCCEEPGLREISKPAALAARGAWSELGDVIVCGRAVRLAVPDERHHAASRPAAGQLRRQTERGSP